MDINGLHPYVNAGVIGQPLHWCIDAMRYALEVSRVVLDKRIDFDTLLEQASTDEGIFALLYGAMHKATGISMDEFAAIDLTAGHLLAVGDGMRNFLPEPKYRPQNRDLDESYPEIPTQEKESAKADFLMPFKALKTQGFSVSEIGNMTLRAVYELLDLADDVGLGADWLYGDL